MSDWLTSPAEPPAKAKLAGTLRAIRRGIPIFATLGFGLALMLLLRLIERPVFGQRRPMTQWITPVVCRIVLRCLGLRRVQIGSPDPEADLSVANHASWLDIFALNAGRRLYFVSKSEVAGWPGIGWLARATGTVFIERRRTEARGHVQQLEDRLAHSHHLMLFPEGTSTDSVRVLPFKPTLFAAFITHPRRIQPVSIVYRAPEGCDLRFYGWWGDMSFGPNMVKMLTTKSHGSIEVHYGQSVDTDGYNRKELAKLLEARVKAPVPSTHRRDEVE